jgi:predicted ABC-type ATPase
LPKPITNIAQLRLRIFAGPNGSGKSTIIKAVREAVVNGHLIDLGYYVNADEIAAQLIKNTFSFTDFNVTVNAGKLLSFARQSGLLSGEFTEAQFIRSFHIRSNKLFIRTREATEHLAQLIARYLREAMLDHNRNFSFETVFSHPSTLTLMEAAVAKGYKVYLYFVSTESVEINKYRVQYRITQGGHVVPEFKIAKRYTLSLGLMYRLRNYATKHFSLITRKTGSHSQ